MKKQPLYAHSYIKYRCRDCSKEWLMFCPAGIEDWNRNSKKAPSPIRCSCGQLADKKGDAQKILVWRKIEPHESYFERYKDIKYGVPVLRGKIHETNGNAKTIETGNTGKIIEIQESKSND